MNPYDGKSVDEWLSITERLVESHPLSSHVVDFCLKSWESIINGKINTYLNLKISQMKISPQATGALLHDIIPEYIERNIDGFRKGRTRGEKDIVCEYDESLSLELKTSSQKSIYGNRSYAKSTTGKNKSGFYLAVNFEKLSEDEPKILHIQMGWLCHIDWQAQKSETGQQASLTKEAKSNKLITLYRHNE
ncbi:MAG: ScaI family restriction endonuclease [Defluviitaleaceae bacterium]|nr:ScaI family restriction endonuclease [Defluviitaleaceae bacterium]